MKKLFKGILTGFFFLAATTGAVTGVIAAEKSTAAEATAMVQKAIAYMKEHGQEKALAEFNNPNGQFVKNDLYIYVYDLQGKNLAHGANQKLVGKNLLDMRDADGKLIIQEFIQTANSKGKGWVDYKWANPTTQTVEPKSGYVEKSGDVIIGSGIYKG